MRRFSSFLLATCCAFMCAASAARESIALYFERQEVLPWRTAHALAEIRARCLREGMQDYITKPVERALLAQGGSVLKAYIVGSR